MMLKRTLFFQSPGYLNLTDQQLRFSSKSGGENTITTIPIEDIGMVVIENPQLTFTSALMQALAKNNTIVVFCDEKHLPSSFFSSMTANETAQKHIRAQLTASEALKNRLWKQTVVAKIRNQAQVLLQNHCDGSRLLKLANGVKNGDPENTEAVAARFYFSRISGERFLRDPAGDMPNAALNYGYAIIRAAMARALAGSGLLCVAGIHHHNQYDPFCLADDIMEPYRPFIDEEVFTNTVFREKQEITQEMKRCLLSLLAADVMIRGMKRPLQNAMSFTSASLVRCFLKEESEIEYPEFCKWQTSTQH